MTMPEDDDLHINELLAENISTDRSDRLGHHLTDARQRFLKIVRERVADNDSDSLTALREGSHGVHKTLYDTATSLTRISDLAGSPFKSSEVAPVHAARALSALGLALVAGPERAAAHLECFRRWIALSGLEVPGQPVRKIPAFVDSPHVSVMRHLADTGDLDLLSLVWMTELDGSLRGDRSHMARVGPSALVLLDRGQHGQRALLSLARVPGLPAGFVPDPATMTLCSADAKFGSSLATAWEVAGGPSRGAVMWSLTDRTGPITRVTGESLGLAFTVLLDELRRQTRPLRGPLTVRRLRPRTALVGRIDPAEPGGASSVSGYDAKLSVVDENMRVVLPSTDFQAAVEANHKYGDNAQLIPVKTWRQAAGKGRSVDRRRLLALVVVVLLCLMSATFVLYRQSESRRTTEARQTASEDAARALMDRSTDNLWERLHLDIRAYRTSDSLDTRVRIRTWANQLRFAQVVVPTNRVHTAGVVNGDGSAAVTPDPTDDSRMLAWDFTASSPEMFPIHVDGVGPAVAAWLGRDVVALSRSQGRTALWNVRTRQLVRQLDAGGNVLVGDPTGRWLGYGTKEADEVHIVNLEHNTVETVPLPDELRQTLLSPLAAVEGILTSGELVVATSNEVIALSPAGTRRLDDRARRASVIDLNQGQAVVASCLNGTYELFGVETSTVLATHVLPGGSCETSLAFTSDPGQVFFVEQVAMPRGRPEPESYVVLGGSTGSVPARRIAIPVGYRLIRAAVEASGTYRLVLNSADTLLVLMVPPPDPMENALVHAQDAVVTTDGGYLILRYPDNHVESWKIATRSLAGTAPPGSAELSQAGASASLVISPNDKMLITVHHDKPAKIWQLPNLQPLGEIPLPAASRTFTESYPDEISAAVSFVSDRLVLVQYGDGFSTWNTTPVVKMTESQISLPEADAPGSWHIVHTGLEQIITVIGNTVQRNRLSDGALVPGSMFTMGDIPSREYKYIQPALDPNSELIAVFHEDAIEIWDLSKHKRIDRHFLPDNTSVEKIRIDENANVVEFVITDTHSKNAAGIFAQRWHRGSHFVVLDWLGFGRAGIAQASDEIIPSTFAWPGPDGALEPANPQAWLVLQPQ